MKTVIGTVALALAATGALAQKTVLRFSTAAPPPDFLSRSLSQFKSELEKSAPEFEVQVYPGSRLFRPGHRGARDAARKGDRALTSSGKLCRLP
jgi:TRAP-type C4-dicarboxylate transport system substrate-binding protein